MIGVFDSGFGGLTILRELLRQLPKHDYIYFGDNAHAPYGHRTGEEIIELTKAGVEYLFSRGASIAILGCNTASVCALRSLQQEWLPARYPNRRLLGIVVPTIEQITGADWRHSEPITTPLGRGELAVGILATPATVASRVYTSEIHKRNPSINIVEQSCPNLAQLIEQQASMEEIKENVTTHLNQLQERAGERLFAVLLGCTHYELIADVIRDALPIYVRLYQQPSIVAHSLEKYLQRHPTLIQSSSRPHRKFITSGDPHYVSQQATRYLGQQVKFLKK